METATSPRWIRVLAAIAGTTFAVVAALDASRGAWLAALSDVVFGAGLALLYGTRPERTGAKKIGAALVMAGALGLLLKTIR